MAKNNRKEIFFEEDTVHGRVKRIMLKKYLQAYIEKTQCEKWSLRTLIIDGFAGVGRYGKEWPSEIDRYGSPLIALMVALGVCYRKEMKKNQNDLQGVIEDNQTNKTSVKTNTKGTPDETRGKSEKTDTYRTSAENGMQRKSEGLEQRGSVESKMQGSSDEIKATQDEIKTSDTGTKESNKSKLRNKNVDSLWGWPASEIDPEADLVSELSQLDRRRVIVTNDSAEIASVNKSTSDKSLDTDEEVPREIQTTSAKISMMFIEKDPNTFQKLAANVELLMIKFLKKYYPSYEYGFRSTEGEVWICLDREPFSILVQIVKGKFADTEPPMMLNDSSVRSLTFLDPFGYTYTPMSHIEKFVPGPGNEVFINFMSSFVNRFVSMKTDAVAKLYGMSDYESVAKLYGLDTPDLEKDGDLLKFVKHVIHSSLSEKEPYNNKETSKYTNAYEHFLKGKTKSKYSLTFEVKDQRNKTLYHMIYITNHVRGVEAMKESMNRCSQSQGEMIMSDYDIVQKGQKLNLGNLDDPIELSKVIFDKFRGRKPELDDIERYVLMETKYLFRKNPLKKLQMEGKITEVVDANGNQQERKYQFPSKDRITKKPINWRVTFADEEYTSGNANSSDIAKTEKQRKKTNILKKETDRNFKKEKQSDSMVQKEKETLKQEIEKDKRKEKYRSVAQREGEKHRRQIKDIKRKIKEAEPEKERQKGVNAQRNEGKMAEEKTERLTLAAGVGSHDGNGSEDVSLTVDHVLETDKGKENVELRPNVSQVASGNEMKTRPKKLMGKINHKKMEAEKRSGDTFLSKTGVETPLNEIVTERGLSKTRKRKVTETPGSKPAQAKRKTGPSFVSNSASGKMPGKGKKGENRLSQKLITKFFKRQDNL